MNLIRAVRGYFDARDFYEVETPALQISPGMEPHIHAFKTRIMGPEREFPRTRYLHTSPEFAMKKLLVAGLPQIYQICHVFRNAEGSHLHSAEFTMLEWYRVRAGYRDIMQDCINLLRHCAEQGKFMAYKHGPHAADPFQEWEIITVCDAFRLHAALDLESVLDNTMAFAAAARAIGIQTATDDRWDDIFFRVFLDRIEPRLGMGRPTIIYDYPLSMAALSRPKADDPRFAERFELYVCGMELANAFGELTDPVAQKARFEADMDLKQKLYNERYPIDEDFIRALEHGLPACSGIALGIDRLAMLAGHAGRIDNVLWANIQR